MPTLTRTILEVPGANLYYETRGSGPCLLLISGGPTDADIFTALADALANRYTVISYDTRGNSRSTLAGPPEDQSIDVECEDAHAVLAAVTSEPAFVFGNSGGAIVGLALADRYPRQVRMLIAHEPPLIQLLPEREQMHAHARDVYDTYRERGVRAGMAKFMAGAGLQQPDERERPAAQPQDAQAMVRFTSNAEHFLAHRFLPMGRYVPDIGRLRNASTEIVVAAGEASLGQFAYRAAAALAGQLDTELVTFPGDHGGFLSHTAQFAEYLHRTIERSQVSGRAR